MSTPNPSTERFRSATDFPKSVNHLGISEANRVYQEMRDCLIFTNRSRSQLIRRNEEHKQTALTLKADVARLQQLIQQAALEKQALLQNRGLVISELEGELRQMSSHLDQLSKAFEDVEDVNGAMGVMAIPGRFARFWQALRALIVWWRDEYGDEPVPSSKQISPSQPPSGDGNDQRENPQMYTDPASVQRSLRDN